MEKAVKLFKFHRWLVVILFLSGILRIWDLGGVPPHLRNDEAALGYNAYSILQTGRDENGQILPIFFESFGDWKPGLYVYLDIPFVALLGLNELAVRLPSAIFGVIAVLVLYLVVLELFGNSKLALFASLLLAISPWHLAFSRGAWEANISLTLVLFGIYFFLTALRREPWYLFISTMLFGATLFTYHSAKLATPIIAIVLLLVFRKKVFQQPLLLLATCLSLILLISIPTVFAFFDGKFARLQSLNTLSYPITGYVQTVLDEGGETRDSLFYYISHNELLVTSRSVLWNWSNHFSGEVLFFEGDTNPQHSAPNAGAFLLLDSVFVIAGFIKLVRLGIRSQTLFLWLWLLLSPLPSALTTDGVNFVRSLNMFVPLVIIMALGVVFLLDQVRQRAGKASVVLAVFIILYFANYFYYLDQYWIHGPKKNVAWQYGYKDIIRLISPIKEEYGKIIVPQGLDQPYIFFLFYQKYPPEKYQRFAQKAYVPNYPTARGYSIASIDNIEFREIDWLQEEPVADTLYVIPERNHYEFLQLGLEHRMVGEVKDLSGFVWFRLIEVL